MAIASNFDIMETAQSRRTDSMTASDPVLIDESDVSGESAGCCNSGGNGGGLHRIAVKRALFEDHEALTRCIGRARIGMNVRVVAVSFPGRVTVLGKAAQMGLTLSVALLNAVQCFERLLAADSLQALGKAFHFQSMLALLRDDVADRRRGRRDDRQDDDEGKSPQHARDAAGTCYGVF